MNKTLIFFALLLSQYTFAQTISVTIKGSPDSVVKINYPINGINYIYWNNGQSYRLNNKNSVQFPNKLKQAGTIYLTNNGKNESIFIEPQKSLDIDILYSDKNKTLKVKGTNAEGIVLMNKLDRPFYILKARSYFKTDSTMAGIQKMATNDMQKELGQFDSLLKAKKITPDFNRYLKRDVRYYYGAVLGAVISQEYYRTTLNPKHPTYKATFDKDFEGAWPELFKSYSLNDEFATGAPDFFFYAKDYVSWYKELYLAKKNGTYNDSFNEQNYFNTYYNGFVSNFNGKPLEYLLARYIHDEAMEKAYQPALVELYKKFTNSYPKSNFTIYLTPLIDEINTFHNKGIESFKANQKVLDSKSVTSFAQLAAQFKGKTVYVDMWATWCGPCKEEFQYNKDLKKYLSSKNVEMLYISMDKDEADKQWLDMVKYYDLSGNHIRTTNSLRKDLVNIFWDGKGYAIPRYVILKDGVVVEKDAMRPSDKDKLYNQISKYL